VLLHTRQGQCHDSSCALSHQLEKGKMPVCAYFLRGVCTRESCPYRHVRVNPNAALCKDFTEGQCSRGDQCPLKHEFAPLPKRNKQKRKLHDSSQTDFRSFGLTRDGGLRGHEKERGYRLVNGTSIKRMHMQVDRSKRLIEYPQPHANPNQSWRHVRLNGSGWTHCSASVKQSGSSGCHVSGMDSITRDVGGDHVKNGAGGGGEASQIEIVKTRDTHHHEPISVSAPEWVFKDESASQKLMIRPAFAEVR